MGFWKNHGAPTLHNAAGTLLAAALIALGGALFAFWKPFRDEVILFVSQTIPVWVVIVIFAFLITPLVWQFLICKRKLRIAVAEIEARKALDQESGDRLRQALEKAITATRPRTGWVWDWKK